MKIKSIVKELLALSFVIFAFACSSSDDGDGSSSSSSITVTGNSSSIFLGESVTFTVVNNNGNNVTASSELKIGDTVITNPYTFSALGSYEVTATKGSLSSSTTITVLEVPEPTSLILSANNEAFWYDTGSTQFSVVDDLGNNLTGLVAYSADTVTLNNPATFASAGTYNVVATFILEDNSIITSNTLVINAVESTHTTKVMVEDYTGTWCQYCPRLAYALEQAVATDANIIPVALHDDNDMPFPNINTLLNTFGITGFPSGRVNRTVNWNESTTQPVSLLNNRQNMGLAINSSISGNTISAEVKVHYDLKAESTNRIVVYLLENGLVYPQVNFYNGDPSSPYFQQGNPIANFVHNHTARTTFTDVFGDIIPFQESDTGDTYTVNYALTVPASVQNTANLEIVAFTVSPLNQVLNVQKANLGENKDFD
ncbi:Omp28-related outer membrane protein [Psychroserpens jangbogonensis]|uniref:Omp28-related outer membrane protein n=1 Tax=Psychroserpens jangbogonensis TaxID=1484460 RepID=UPI0006909D09|nr:Omp28-related outer membrane protein [Psychroserpens jangbogonensis]